MRLSDFDFDLPDHLIATRPARPRSSARLLAVAPDRLADLRVTDLTRLLRPGDRLVVNDTRVIPARLDGVRMRPGGPRARVEVTLMEPAAAGGWRVMARPLRKLAPGDRMDFGAGLSAEVAERGPEDARLVFDATGEAFHAA
ncbi:MAG TPA: S-adenosylmethionine:tRNA ribosyltransferase-isomerase, partial [Paracoccaceae bacterium]|nr:S-adenosylmethionine:tRNA ribosyltransferase-isomerase [Paracoccaceae bacterium]